MEISKKIIGMEVVTPCKEVDSDPVKSNSLHMASIVFHDGHTGRCMSEFG